MAERQQVPDEREVTAKDVFARSNMPSRWERLTNVAPKTSRDREYLAFVAARYRGDVRLPLPDEIAPPVEIHTRVHTKYMSVAAAAFGLLLAIPAEGAEALLILGIVLIVGAVVGFVVVYAATQPAVSQYYSLRDHCARAEARLHADPLDSENTSTLNSMITRDEGTLAYCAAKIASEIEKEANWQWSRIDILPIDLRDELAEVGESARQIAEDYRATRALESSRLRDDPDVRATIDEDKAARKEALALLAARVSKLADYRDQVQRLSMYAHREEAALSRTVRRVVDQYAAKRPL